MGSTVNYEDERFQKVESEKADALNEIEQTYGNMIDQTDKYYQDQINASKEWADTQTELQNQQLEHTTNKIEQQREQTQKDYLKEQSGAYVDWQKQSNDYGAEAERMAAQGLANTGYSETSQVSMYNTYQNRIAVAREAFVQANLNYDNAIKDAQLQNSAALAEIAYNAYQQQLALSLQGFQYKNQLILDQTNKKLEVDQMYYGRWQDVLAQINTENALAEQKRQANLAHSRAQAQLKEEQRQFDAQMAYQKEQDAKSAAQINKGSSSSSAYKGVPSAEQLVSRVKNKTKESDTKQASVNMQSVIDLGYGPISATKLAQLEASGQITSYVKNGQRYYKKTAKTSKLMELYGM